MSRSAESLDKEEKVFESFPSTWELVLDHCPENEVEEVKRILGTSLIEQAADLHDEVNTLLEIWHHMQDDTDEMMASRETQTFDLAEPPYVRERLIQEIKFFISHLKNKTSVRDMSSGSGKPHLVEYVTCADEAGSGRSSGGSRPRSTISSRDGSQASLLNELESVSEQINASDVERIVKNLRHLLEEECDRHRSNLQFLQKSLEDEQGFASSLQQEQKKPIPSIAELREFGSQLEREYLSGAQQSPGTPKTVHHASSPLPPAKPRPQQGIILNRASKVRHEVLASRAESRSPSKVLKSPRCQKHITSQVPLPSIESNQVVDSKPL